MNNTSLAPLISKNVDILACPACSSDLKLSSNSGIKCVQCRQSFKCQSSIPLLFWPNEWDSSKNDVTRIVQNFYDANPFPNYEEIDSPTSLRERAQLGLIAQLLDEQISSKARIVEIGCGTGQLSNFLGMAHGRTVFATDISLISLKLGNEFSKKHKIDSVAFVQLNLFRPAFKPESFDLAVCLGVLHHTSDPSAGFQSISKLVKKNGFIIIGLYNRYGRIPLSLTRLVYRARHWQSKNKQSSLKKRTWLIDQYLNPCESTHTISEVLSWFDKNGIKFINSIPKARAFEGLSPEQELFKVNSKGTWLDHLIVQTGIMLSLGKNAGSFLMIGRKR